MKIWLKNSFSNGISGNNSFNDCGVWWASCTRHFESLASRPYFRLYCSTTHAVRWSVHRQTFFSLKTINSNRHTSTVRREASFYLALLATIVVICRISECGSISLSLPWAQRRRRQCRWEHRRRMYIFLFNSAFSPFFHRTFFFLLL